MFKNCRIIGKDISPAKYHAHEIPRGDKAHPVSPSMLKNFIHCPSRWRKGYEQPESASKDFGNLLDTLLLTPQFFDARYIIQPENYESKELKCPQCGSVTDSKTCRKCKCDREESVVVKPWSNNSTTCAEWTAAQAKAGREVVTQEFYSGAQAAVKRMTDDEIIFSFVKSCDNQVLVEGEWLDEATGLILPVRCLIDLVPRIDSEFATSLGDVKTARSASLGAFRKDCIKFGYHLQSAFDLDLFNAATGEHRVNWCLPVVENFAPFEFGRRMMRDVEPGEQPESKNAIVLGRAQYRRALATYARCLASGKWPSYDDTDESSGGWTMVEVTPWEEQEFLFAPTFATETQPAYQPGDDLMAGA